MNAVTVRNVVIGEGKPKICVPIIGVTREEILEEAINMRSLPHDIVEWRADWFDQIFEREEMMEVLRELRKVLGETPILFTFRTEKEGGQKPAEQKDYVRLNKMAASTGCVDMIDVELVAGDENVKEIIEEAHRHQVKVIASSHDFEKTPEKDEMISKLCRMQDLGADILKIAVMPQTRRDVLTLLLATEEMYTEHAKCPIVTMSMSAAGMISRLCGEFFGSAITFGSAGKASAPGQAAVEELDKILTFLHESLGKE